MQVLRRMVDANDASVDASTVLAALAALGMLAIAAWDTIRNGRPFDAQGLGIGIGALLGGGGGASMFMRWRQATPSAPPEPIVAPRAAPATGSREVDDPDAR